MADSRKGARSRTTQSSARAARARSSREAYVRGTAVPRTERRPERDEEADRRIAARHRAERERQRAIQQRLLQQREAERASQELAAQVQRNREKAKNAGASLVFLLVVCVALMMYCCVQNLQAKSQITARMNAVAEKEGDLAALREENDAYLSEVTSGVDLNEIKKIAIGRLGMKYPSDDQIRTYETEGKSYVRQYQDVPTD